ncbi:hypothetical protein [Geotalea toluenoxydans]|uniref:hypothetical protein n=1 Tax=Geotalea toluenoxydans TaxID=421624 RepID=UPI0006D159A8|nr:hypothetical protein [Geotalea toluenoxydans]
MTATQKLLLLALFTFFFAGCAQIQDMVIRSMHMDRGYRGHVLPMLFERYRLKMEHNDSHRQGPVFIVPDFADQA